MTKVKRKFLSINDKKSTTDENTNRSDGTSLAMGTAEYKELINDRQGLTEFEQEAKRLDKYGLELSPEYNQKQEMKANELLPDSLRLKNDSVGASAAQRRQMRQELKRAEMDEIMGMGISRAAQTPSKDDDVQVRHQLPEELLSDVYDDSVSYDDYYPGSKTINKFID